MRISEKKKTELYNAISDPIMDLRVTIQQSLNVLGQKNVDDIDLALFRLNRDVWKKIKTVLITNKAK